MQSVPGMLASIVCVDKDLELHTFTGVYNDTCTYPTLLIVCVCGGGGATNLQFRSESLRNLHYLDYISIRYSIVFPYKDIAKYINLHKKDDEMVKKISRIEAR